MLAISYFVLVKFIYPNHLGHLSDAEDIIQNELDSLGQISPMERRVIVVFILTMLLWILRSPLNEILPFIHFTDAGISMLAAFVLFTIPFKFNRGSFILEWEDTVRLPWGILILFGGGLALASSLSSAGVIDHIGQIVSQNNHWSIAVISAVLIGIMLFMTELMSNVALVAIFAPVIAGIAMGLDANLMHMLIPITMASSCAFMLPMATPPNAIVFASGHIKVHEMAKAGFFLNIISIGILIVFMQCIIPMVF